MQFAVEFTAEFAVWLDGLTQAAQDTVFVHIRLLQQQGPALGRSFVDTLKGAKSANLKSFAYSIVASLCESSSPSIRDALPFYSSVATKPETLTGTTST
jgi:hypothetical protein